MCKNYKNLFPIIEVIPPRNAPQRISTATTFIGQLLSIEKFVNSYVPYTTSPNNDPIRKTDFGSLEKGLFNTKINIPTVRSMYTNAAGIKAGDVFIIPPI